MPSNGSEGQYGSLEATTAAIINPAYLHWSEMVRTTLAPEPPDKVLLDGPTIDPPRCGNARKVVGTRS